MTMTSAKLVNPDRGPLKLDHDGRPRDLTKFNPSVDSITKNQNFRYRGFPASNFLSPRDPVTVSKQLAKAEPEKPAWFGRSHIFDKNKPQLDEDHEGVQYSSDKANHSNKPTPRRVRDPFREKTSAELKKYREQQMEAESEILKYKEERLNQLRETENQKRMDLELLKNYDPWGRPGGGAPVSDSSDYKRQKFLEHSSSDSQKGQGDDGFHDQFGKQGGGAPLKTSSGHVRTELKVDPMIRFQNSDKGRRVIDEEIRYRRPGEEQMEYSNDLRQQIADKALNDQQARIQKLKRELDMLHYDHDPFGKPGAGAPNKTESGNLAINKTTTLSDDYEEVRRIENRRERRSISATQGLQQYGYPLDSRQIQNAPTRRARMIDRDRGVLTQSAGGQGIHVGGTVELGTSQGAGAPLRTGSGHIKTKMAATLKKDNYGDNIVREDPRNKVRDEYNPFGKSGAGAPLVDNEGQRVTNIYGKMQQERMSEEEKKKAATAYLLRAELKREMEEQRNNIDNWNWEQKQGAGELASLMNRGVVGKPRRDPNTGYLLPQHLPSTDVTKQQVNQAPVKNEETPRYHTELERAAEERKRALELEKLREKQESRQHAQVFSDMWGRPGGGAPNSRDVRIHDITNNLYSPRHGHDGSEYSEPLAHSPIQLQQKHTRKAVPSHHLNSYDYENHGRQRKRDYKLLAPWAVES